MEQSRVIRAIRALQDVVLYSKWFIQYLERSPLPAYDHRKISVAIPHFNRGEWIHRAFKNIWRDERIDDIVLLDDGSNEASFSQLRRTVQPFSNKTRVFRRTENRGTLATKIETVSLCRNSWVILLDSDNSIFTSYLDALYRLQEWRPDTIYCPDYAYPNFDFRILSGQSLDFNDIHKMVLDGSLFGPFINDGNYFLNKDSFLETLSPFQHYQVYAADVIFANYIWLSKGKVLKVLQGASYYHRVHPGSTWKHTQRQSARIFETIHEWFRQSILAGENDFSIFSKMTHAHESHRISIPLVS